MCKLTISDQGQKIVAACETKVRLQARAEALSEEARALVARLKEISDEQYGLLQNMKDLDLKIEFLAQSVLSKT